MSNHNLPSVPRAQIYALLILTSLIFITIRFLSDNIFSNNEAAKPARDFIAFWATSKLSLSGNPSAAYDLNNILVIIKETVGYEQGFPWLYPPTFQTIILPLALIDYKYSYILFNIVTMVFFSISARKLAPKREYILAIIAFPAIYTAIIYGQNSLLTAALAILGIYYVDKKPIIAGVFIGTLALKPQMAILFPFALLFGRHWKALISTSLTFVANVLISLYLFGYKTWIVFFASINTPKLWLETGQISWEKMISTFSLAKMVGFTTESAYLIHFSIALIFISVMIYFWLHKSDIALRGSSLALASIVSTPYAFEYELTWIAIPILMLANKNAKEGWLPWQREVLVIAWIFPLLNLALNTLPGRQICLALLIELMLLSILVQSEKFNKVKEKKYEQ